MILIFSFIVGLCLGSFFNVLLARLPRGKSIMGRSQCIQCLRTLSWFELFPVFSFILLRGKCRTCKTSIANRYPAVELITAMVVFLLVWQRGVDFVLFQPWLSILVILYVLLAFFDSLYMILPDVIIFPAIGIAVIYVIRSPMSLNLILSSLLFTAFFAILYLVSRGKWLGFGDVKLVALIGLTLGYPLGFAAVLMAIWIGAIIGIGFLLIDKKNLKKELPLGTFLCLTTIITIIWEPLFNQITRLL
ncbi:prepilin peptidase [Candidatus Parcubacteria bacterium]|nr:prepilin peptidase [Candidatus Parcubacteria bacterium]